jgi:hypothetical protein
MALVAIVVWSLIILGISMVAMVTQQSDLTFVGEGGEAPSWETAALSSRRSA